MYEYQFEYKLRLDQTPRKMWGKSLEEVRDYLANAHGIFGIAYVRLIQGTRRQVDSEK